MGIVRRSIAQREDQSLATSSVNRLEGKCIIGIDPGTNILGYSVIKVTGGEAKTLVIGVIKLGKFTDRYQKLRHIFERLTSILEQYQPDEMALEAPFFGENVQSMLKLGRAQGVAMVAALVRDIPVAEYAPMRIKQSITGRGSASKEQVAALLSKITHFENPPRELDATDALAVAVCHMLSADSYSDETTTKKPGGSWEQFINQNPNKVQR